MRRLSLTEKNLTRFWSKVNRQDISQCWMWLGGTNKGYGSLWVMTGEGEDRRSRAVPAHRIAYEVLRDPIPDGLVLDHRCRTRACCNPWHLEVVTNEENIARGTWSPVINAVKTECIAGHSFDAENTYIIPGTGYRQCRKCQQRRNAERSERKKLQRRSRSR